MQASKKTKEYVCSGEAAKILGVSTRCSTNGAPSVPSPLPEPTAAIGGTSSLMSSTNSEPQEPTLGGGSATPESRPPSRKKTWKDKKSCLEASSLVMSASQMWDQDLTSNEEGSQRLSTPQYRAMSKRLWLPTRTDSAALVSDSSRDSSSSTPRAKSWFSMVERRPQKKNSLMTSFQLSQYSLLDHTGSEVTASSGVSGNKPKKKYQKTARSHMRENKTEYKTLKFRLHPTPDQEKWLQLMMSQQRWYYNAALNIVYNHYGYENILTPEELTEKEKEKLEKHKRDLEQALAKKKPNAKKVTKLQNQIAAYTTNRKKFERYSEFYVRDEIVRKHQYQETVVPQSDLDKECNRQFVFQEFVYDETRDAFPLPPWWTDEESAVHCQVPRGAIYKLVSALNAAISNYEGGHVKKFMMHYKSHKHPVSTLTFCDGHYPRANKGIKNINKIESVYTYNKDGGGRGKMSLTEVMEKAGTRGFEIMYDKETNRYYLHYPVDRGWFPDNERHHKNRRENSSVPANQVISLDPGVRKFMVGYDPTECTVFIGKGASLVISKLLLQVDSIKDKPGDTAAVKESKQAHRRALWRSIKGKVVDLHWKTINYLVSKYDTILYPNFRTAGMVRKKDVNPMTKRLLSTFSFYSFKQRLEYKVKAAGKHLVIVDESYTSRTCTLCGFLNDSTKLETLTCSSCSGVVDRDVNGARNILLKNLKVHA